MCTCVFVCVCVCVCVCNGGSGVQLEWFPNSGDLAPYSTGSPWQPECCQVRVGGEKVERRWRSRQPSYPSLLVHLPVWAPPSGSQGPADVVQSSHQNKRLAPCSLAHGGSQPIGAPPQDCIFMSRKKGSVSMFPGSYVPRIACDRGT